MDEYDELTAFCGLYCGDCIRYRSKASDLAAQLLDELGRTEFGKYAGIKCSPERQFDPVRQFEDYSRCCDVLQAIAALRCSTPCRTGGGCSAFTCGILECCREKGLPGCWQCAGFESCEKLDGLKSIHGDSVRQNLKAIGKYGPDSWLEHRNKPYIWQHETVQEYPGNDNS